MKLCGQSGIQNVPVESSGSKQTSVAEAVLDLRRFGTIVVVPFPSCRSSQDFFN